MSEPVDSIQQSLYAKRQKVYPREVHGLFAYLRVLSVAVLLGLFYGVAWLRWDGRQAVLFDLPARKFYIFGWTFWPQDLFYLALLLILAALSLFFFTALAGRLFCGYACPQTVWTEVFLWIERKIEGSRNQQIKRDKTSWNIEKIRVKATKHSIWIAFSLYTGFTFVGYFTPIRELAGSLVTFQLSHWETFWVIFYGFATYGNAGWMREQVCIYMCPYARFQSAMFDKDTLIIAYDDKRGETRGARKRSVVPAEQGLGDCVDCSLCVQVCPTGIDIRNGLQYQCIGCAACIDACDEVMVKMDYKPGLVRYTTQHAIEGKATHIIRPRMLVYALLLISLLTAVVYSISQRIPLALDVIRDRNSLYKETPEGLIENVYLLRIMNRDTADHIYTLTVDGIQGLQMIPNHPPLTVKTGEIISIPLRLTADPANLTHRSSSIRLVLTATDNPHFSVTEEARFLGPF